MPGQFLKFISAWVILYILKFLSVIWLLHISFHIDCFSSKFYESACTALFALYGLIDINTSISIFIHEYAHFQFQFYSVTILLQRAASAGLRGAILEIKDGRALGI